MTKILRNIRGIIDGLQDRANTDSEINNLLSTLKEIEGIIGDDEGSEPRFHLPYTSEPKYIDESWKYNPVN